MINMTVSKMRGVSEQEKPLRAQAVSIAIEFLPHFFMQGNYLVGISKGLPPDARVIGMHSDGRRLCIAFESESFPIVRMTDPIPEEPITMTRHTLVPEDFLKRMSLVELRDLKTRVECLIYDHIQNPT